MTLAPLEPADALDDARLARAAAGGDRIAFTAIYDRYADRLHDFCAGMLRDRDAAADCVQDVFVIAAGKLAALEDPDRLRAWLYAIARHEALACLKKRRRERPSDELPDIVSADPDLATVAARHELADLIDEAFCGLSDRDRTVYELAYRHGLCGQELADALGVSHTNARTLLARVRDGIERSLGALLVCRRAKFDPAACPGLWELLESWDGAFTVLMRKRVARHIDDCPLCESERRRMVNPAALLGATPVLLPAPAWLRAEVLGEATPALPSTGGEVETDVEPWWPPNDIHMSERRSPAGLSHAQKRHARAALTATLGLLGIGGAAVLSLADEPVRPTGTSVTSSTTTSAQVFSVASIPQSSASAPETIPPLPPVTTSVAPAPSLTLVAPTPTITTTSPAPAETSTSRPAPTRSFTPSRISPTAARPVTRTSAPSSSTSVPGSMTVSPIPGTPPVVTPPSDPVE
jgi:RNA polymerase sigma factor (sigma-70 family)